MPIKLLKWPRSVSGLFPADAKRTLELTIVPTAPSLDECIESIKKVYDNMTSIKIYFFDGFEVMPIAREEDFAFCMKRFQMNHTMSTILIWIDFTSSTKEEQILLPIVTNREDNHPLLPKPKLVTLMTSLNGCRRRFLLLKLYREINSSVLVAKLGH